MRVITVGALGKALIPGLDGLVGRPGFLFRGREYLIDGRKT